jgi:hypothetical protein
VNHHDDDLGYPLVESQWNRILQTLLKVEKRWTAALPVVQQLVSNYSILAEQGRDASSDER